MDNLKNSGLQLRSINLVDYEQLIQDLRYNFTQILNMPGFKGMPGQSIVGETGVGVRGSKWVFVTINDIQSLYPSITSVEQITLPWINSSFNEDPTKLFNSFYIPGDDALLVGDILVLPSGQLIELAEITVDNVSNIVFIDTGITFAQVSTLTENRVIELFNQLYSNVSTSSSALRHFSAIAKNGPDTSPALNSVLNQDSVIDIVVTGSGPGASLPAYTFVAGTEQDVNTTTKMCFIAGSPKKYHELIQSTQTIYTNNYAPGVDDFASAVFLQNSYSNGILFGHAESESIRQFGRLFKTVDATVLTSSYSPFENEYSDLKLYDNQAILRSLSATINVTSLDILAQVYNSKMFSYAGTVAKLADFAGTSLEIYAPAGTYLKNITSANFLGTDTTGKIIKAYSLINTLVGTLNSSQIVDALTIQTEITSLSNKINAIDSRVTILESSDNSKFFQKLAWQKTSLNFNTLTDNGNYVVESNTNISNFIPSITVAPADMIVNAFVSSIDGVNVRVVQEVTIQGPTEFATFMNGIKWFRLGFKTGASAWGFTPWSKMVTGADKILGDSVLIPSGSFNTGDMKLSHKGKAQGLVDSSNENLSVIRNLSFDNYGHVIGYESFNVGPRLKSSIIYLTNWKAGGLFTVSSMISDLTTIVSCTATLECVTANNGYSVGKITQVPSSFEPSDSGGHNFDQGIAVNYSVDSQTFYVAIGQQIWIRNNLGSSTSTNNVILIATNNNAQITTWKIRPIVLYY